MEVVLQLLTLAALALLALRLDGVRRRLDALDGRWRPPVGPRRDVPPEAVRRPRAPGAGRTVEPLPPARSAPQPAAATPEGVSPDRGATRPPAIPAPIPAAPGGVPARPRLDFELRFGRRWAALLGGGLVVIGLALLLRHGIERGYLPPALRLGGAALLSLALCLAAEMFRRRGTFAAAAEAAGLARRAADAPSVLLGTGLAGLFACAYAAQAAYGLVGPAPAFLGMAAVALAGLSAAYRYGPALAVLGFLAAEGAPLLVGGVDSGPAAAYAALVGVAGYGAAHVGGWRRLENPAGAVLLLWSCLLAGGPHVASPLTLALVAVPAGAAALAVTALRLRPRAAWTDWGPSARACLALLLVAGQGLLLAARGAWAGAAPGGGTAAALGFGLLLAGFAFAATATRARPAAPMLAAALLGALLATATLAEGRGEPDPAWLACAFAAVSAAALAAAAVALRRGSRRSPLTGLVGAASAAALLAAADLALHAVGALDGRPLAGFAALQGAALLALARPRRGGIPPARQFATAAAGSAGVALLGLAPVLSGVGDGPLLALVPALAAAGAAGLAVLWRSSLIAAVAGAASVPALAGCALGLVRGTVAGADGGGALWPFLADTLLPGLVLAGGAALLRRGVGAAAVREADRCWLGLLGVRLPPPQAGQAVSLVLADAAGVGLLSAALVGFVRCAAFGAPFAPPSAPADLGLACAVALSGALAASRLDRAAPHAALRDARGCLVTAAACLAAAALVANPFVTGAPVGPLPGLNLLALAYGLPAAAAWLLARDLAGPGRADTDALRRAAAALAMAGLLGFASFSVSQLFQGSAFALAGVAEPELWAYTAAWLAFAAAVMARGLRRGSRALRVAALAIVAATAAKVATVDLAGLTGAARAASVLALGLALLGVGMAYQRLAAPEARP